MYRSFYVENYRCLTKLELSDLRRVNLVVGRNNMGKTALLEALFLGGSYNPQIVAAIDIFRGVQAKRLEFNVDKPPPWSTIFRDFDPKKPILLQGSTEQGKHEVQLTAASLDELPPSLMSRLTPFPAKKSETEKRVSSLSPSHASYARVLKLVYKDAGGTGTHFLIMEPQFTPQLTLAVSIEPPPPPPPFQTVYISAPHITNIEEDANRFSKLQVEKRTHLLLDALRIIEPRLKSIYLALFNGEAMLHGDIGEKRLIPLPLMGAGTARIASIVLAMSEAAGGVLLIDEIENGLHHSVLEKFWEVIGKTAQEFKVQIFATTHSLECIHAAHKAFLKQQDYDFALYRLDRKEETVCAVRYDRGTLEAAIEMELEVR
ncbi:MAG TPA: AAA family ATPase [Chthonomonas sp.]|uniref:AAA family ATPase n=1 Tax=Chthonomonas sp. TaxID=2282153 RepID=UPI002B4B6B2E|nr:AAA family ATPase [Chthonomonas sp.]HLI48025.1 AAA family ATPase [Chthonomonas sp.]